MNITAIYSRTTDVISMESGMELRRTDKVHKLITNQSNNIVKRNIFSVSMELLLQDMATHRLRI